MKGNLKTLKKIVFERNKIAECSSRRGDVRVSFVLTKEGLWFFIFDETKFYQHLTRWEKLTDKNIGIRLLLKRLYWAGAGAEHG